MSKKVLTIGGAMQDIFIECEDTQTMLTQSSNKKQSFILLEEGKKIEVEHLLYFVGGGAANAAVSFKLLDFDVAAFFKIGKDHQGNSIIATLKDKGINIDHVISTDKASTGTSFIIPSPTGNRAALVYRGANLTLQQSELPLDALAECDQLYVTSLSEQASSLLLPITEHAKKLNKSVAVNPGGSQLFSGIHILQKALKHIDIFILNAGEAKKFMASLLDTNPELATTLTKANAPHDRENVPQLLRMPQEYHSYSFTLMDYCKTIFSFGPKIIVITNGAEGVYVATQKELYFYPSLPVKVVSTLGAGDAFASTFVGCLLADKKIEEALIAGIINSASVIGHLGTQTGLLTREELDQKLAQADKKLLLRINLT